MYGAAPDRDTWQRKASEYGTDEHKMHESTCKLIHACFADLGLEK